VAEVLVLAVEPVGAADGLEQAMVLHHLVDVEAGARPRVEAGEQLVHHHQQLLRFICVGSLMKRSFAVAS
jgi:hypothetical protein